MSTLRFMHKAIIKKLSDFKDIYKYTSSYQAAFDQVVDVLTAVFYHTQMSIEMYFQAMMLINIGPKYFRLVSAILKNWKDETTNLVKAILQIIRYFKFIEDTKKDKSGFSTSQTSTSLSRAAPATLKQSYKNPECIKKGLTTHFTNFC